MISILPNDSVIRTKGFVSGLLITDVGTTSSGMRNCVGVGPGCLANGVTGALNNCCLGVQALQNLTTGSHNMAMGTNAG